MSEKITINGKEYPLAMKMLAARTYQQLTGKSLLGVDALSEIFGNKENGFASDATLFVVLVYAMIENGAYPAKPDVTIDDVANAIGINDSSLVGSVTRTWIFGSTGKTPDQIESEKNQTAPPQNGALQ